MDNTTKSGTETVSIRKSVSLASLGSKDRCGLENTSGFAKNIALNTIQTSKTYPKHFNTPQNTSTGHRNTPSRTKLRVEAHVQIGRKNWDIGSCWDARISCLVSKIMVFRSCSAVSKSMEIWIGRVSYLVKHIF